MGTARFPLIGSVPGERRPGELEERPAPAAPGRQLPGPLQDSGGGVGRGPAEGRQRERGLPQGAPSLRDKGHRDLGCCCRETPGQGWDGEMGLGGRWVQAKQWREEGLGSRSRVDDSVHQGGRLSWRQDRDVWTTSGVGGPFWPAPCLEALLNGITYC